MVTLIVIYFCNLLLTNECIFILMATVGQLNEISCLLWRFSRKENVCDSLSYEALRVLWPSKYEDHNVRRVNSLNESIDSA